MTTLQIRQQERIVNAELARLLRERCGLDAQAEVIVDGRQPDILIVRPDDTPVIVETEFMPARSVNDDALAKLGMVVGGRPTGVTFAVKLPIELRNVGQDHLFERVAQAALSWQEWYSDVTSGAAISGAYEDLCEHIRRATPRMDIIADAVNELETGATNAGAILQANPVTMQRVATVFDREPAPEVANMAALMVINAMVFHERLASVSIDTPLLPRDANDDHDLVGAITPVWAEILKEDYWPVFRTAYDVLLAIPSFEGHIFTASCLSSAHRILAKPVMGRHDLAGQVFNRLVADRKFLAANYTTIPIATMLAGLALDEKLWPEIDWTDVNALRELAVLDPACGTGTLLMAAYREVTRNHRSAVSSDKFSQTEESLHRTLIENCFHGADVVDAAIHITASTLASMVVSVKFDKMNLHVFPLEVDEIDGPRLGSLDWMDSEQIRALFSGAGEQVGALKGITSTTLDRPEPKLIIANPPYRRHNSATGEGEARTRVFGHKDVLSERKLAKRLSALLSDEPGNQIAGLGSAFLCLADTLLKSNGRLAFVLPATSVAGTSWAQIRRMLSERYQVEYVISSHDPNPAPMSFDTDINEVLLVARKLRDDESPSGRASFVNLWRHPKTENEALALVGAMRRSPVASHRIDGPPVGGTPILLGNDQWGEIVDSPLGGSPWLGSRWMNAACGQYAYSLSRGELWDANGMSKVADIPIRPLEGVASLSAYHLQVKGTAGVFDIYEGHDPSAQFPALWHHSAKMHQSIANRPNAKLSPKSEGNYGRIWDGAGRLHLTPDIRYTSQRIHAAYTSMNALGARSWLTLQLKRQNTGDDARRLLPLAIWLNSTLGMFCHALHSNRSQTGRGLGNRTMLRTLPTLDASRLSDWQIDAAENMFRDFRDVQFEPFYRCDVDSNRVRLDERLVRDVLGCSTEAVEAVARIRSLIANEPSIYGNKQPALP